MSRTPRSSTPRPRKVLRNPTRKEMNYYVATMLRELAQLARDGGRETLALHIEVAAREAEDDEAYDSMN